MDYRRILFTPRGFLIVGGSVLVLLGIIGFLDVFRSPGFYLTPGENLAHLGLGVVALAAVFVPGLNEGLSPYHRSIVILIGVIALFFSAYGFLLPGGNPPGTLNMFGLANLEPMDSLLHLLVAAWAFVAAFRKPQPAMIRG